MPAVFFSTSLASRKVNEACPLSDPSRPGRLFCHAFQRLFFLRLFLSEPPLSSAPCWRTVATFYPLGNCDSLKPETVLSYLTRLGAVSFRTSSLSPFFALTDGARTPPEELVNSASATMPCGFVLEEPCQPAWPDFSPVTWDYPGDLRRLSLGRPCFQDRQSHPHRADSQ
jgi:hypothetical protein